MDELEQQVRVSKMLGMAFVLSITGIGGVGSLVALILGWKAARIIQASHGTISGSLMSWWCILAGAVGTIVLPLFTIGSILEALNNIGK